jgi:hypothetical protein
MDDATPKLVQTPDVTPIEATFEEVLEVMGSIAFRAMDEGGVHFATACYFLRTKELKLS